MVRKTRHTKKSKTIKSKSRPKNRTIKYTKTNTFIIPTNTPPQIIKISDMIDDKLHKETESYSPTINQRLVTLKSIPRKPLKDCNTHNAFKLLEPLQIGVATKCYPYYSRSATKFLLKNLAANKHIDPNQVIPPIQSHSNCWFNAMFVTFFVSDKGRKFFHFLRQLMIEGKQMDGSVIPEKLRNAFALLNFGVDAALTGNEYAYKLNTNSIIHTLYKGIPSTYRQNYPYIVDIDEAGNPLLYYISIINYLNNRSVQSLLIRDANSQWKDSVSATVSQMGHLPHIIVLEVYDEMAGEFNKKPVRFSVKEAKYEIDSAVVRDISKQHFCATLTCEGREMAYDGMSFHRLVDMNWKHKMNSNFEWEFKGSNDHDNKALKWNFTKSYQLLIYYRIV